MSAVAHSSHVEERDEGSNERFFDSVNPPGLSVVGVSSEFV